jgi:3-phosphoshikimate 1-carboxyvinyltransferase
MLSALASGESTIRNLSTGEDVHATIRCLRMLGTDVQTEGSTTRVISRGTMTTPNGDLDAGNSGTTTRLLAGILAAQTFRSRLTGDASLRRRPMDRIVEPLSMMGARIHSDDGRIPLEIEGAHLRGIRYELPVASAQVKSSILLAGLFAEGETVVVERRPTRDHTERMLRNLGVDCRSADHTIVILGGRRPNTLDLTVPGDVSSAAFFFAAAALSDGRVTIRGVNLNPTRSAFLNVLSRMGATVETSDTHEEGGEPVGKVTVRGRATRPIEIGPDDVPLTIDELPLIVLLATQAEGTSSIRGAEELRLKEADRIGAVTKVLRAMGARIRELPDGLEVDGPAPLRGASISSHGDHRIAMMLAVAGSVAAGETFVRGSDAAAVSFPDFADSFRRLGAHIESV